MSRLWRNHSLSITIAVLFLGTGLEYLNGVAMQGMTPEQYTEAVSAGLADPSRARGKRDCAAVGNDAGFALIWIAAILLSAAGGIWFWGTWWCVPFFFVYGTLYGSSSDAR